MRKVELVKGISSSALGFGCAPILGSVGAKQALRALECALDCGITHFDVARSYGYGEAEGFVGKVLKNRRDKVIMASKFGITANWKAQLISPAKPLLRYAKNKLKNNRLTSGAPATVADRFHDRLPITGKVMQASLEKSLRALKTDYLDHFFVHETYQPIADIDELALTAEKLKKEGKIRAWGITFMRQQEHMHQLYLERFDVLQFDCSPFTPGYDDTVKKRAHKANIIFSPLKGNAGALSPAEKLTKLFTDLPDSVVLVSMFNEDHLRQNAALLNGINK